MIPLHFDGKVEQFPRASSCVASTHKRRGGNKSSPGKHWLSRSLSEAKAAEGGQGKPERSNGEAPVAARSADTSVQDKMETPIPGYPEAKRIPDSMDTLPSRVMIQWKPYLSWSPRISIPRRTLRHVSLLVLLLVWTPSAERDLRDFHGTGNHPGSDLTTT